MKISIITVNYNDLDGLTKTVESVRGQTWQEFEHIIIDGGSSDGSKEFILEQQEYLSHWVSEPDAGVYSAMNKGIAIANGEYVIFLNAGDHFSNHLALENAHSFLTGEDIVYFDLEVIEGEKTFTKAYPNTLSFSYFVDDTLPHPATFITKTAFAKAGTYKEDFKIVSDWKFFIDAICKFQLTYKHVPEVLTTFYIGGMSSDPKNWSLKEAEKQGVLNEEYTLFYQDVEEIVLMKRVLNSLKKSRIINALVRLKLLNKF